MIYNYHVEVQIFKIVVIFFSPYNISVVLVELFSSILYTKIAGLVHYLIVQYETVKTCNLIFYKQ